MARSRKSGKWDIVYFVKDCINNEELRYSLRSVEENWQYRDVWFYGGKPNGINPDHYVKIVQTQPTKWERVRAMLREACNNEEITENFWLFNDDFFILRSISEDVKPQYTGTIQERIDKTRAKRNGEHSEWTLNLERLNKTLESVGKSTLDYALHKPLLINKKKLAEVLDLFPDEPMVRSLYANYWEIGGELSIDMKIAENIYVGLKDAVNNWEYLSTSDESFQLGNVGQWIRSRFDVASRFEE